MLEFIFDNFSNQIKDKIINRWVKECLDLELLKWIESKKIEIYDDVWEKILSNLFQFNLETDNLFEIFYYVVKKIIKSGKKIDWNNYYSRYKFNKGNELIKYLIDIGEIHIDLNDYSSNSNYYEYYKIRSTFVERKKYIENYYSAYQKKNIDKIKSSGNKNYGQINL